MPFEDLGDWAELASLTLPITNKGQQFEYVIPPVDAENGPRVQALMDRGVRGLLRIQAKLAKGETLDPNDPDLTDQLLSDADERELYPKVLGPAWQQMQDDGIPWPAIQHAAATAMIDATQGRQMAEQFWSTRAPGKATPASPLSGNRAQRRATAKATRTGSRAGSTSRTTGSKAAASPGRKSSASGR